jgi:hypothetical protein
MPGKGNYGTTYDRVNRATQRANIDLLDRLFTPASRITHAELIKVAKQYLTPTKYEADLVSYWRLDPNSSANFTDGPSFDDVQRDVVDKNKGAAGWPTTPYTPPLASPGVENKADFNKIPETVISVADLQAEFGASQTGVNGTVDPKKSASDQAAANSPFDKEYEKGVHRGGPSKPEIVP